MRTRRRVEGPYRVSLLARRGLEDHIQLELAGGDFGGGTLRAVGHGGHLYRFLRQTQARVRMVLFRVPLTGPDDPKPLLGLEPASLPGCPGHPDSLHGRRQEGPPLRNLAPLPLGR